MADLKFADYEREWIAKNKVDTTYRIIAFNRNIDLGPEPDTADITTYNINGRPLYIERPGFWAGSETYTYDSLGFAKDKLDRVCMDVLDKYQYEFNADSLLLIQSAEWITYNNQIKKIPVKNYFNSNGQIIMRVEHRDTTLFEYDNIQRLREISGNKKHSLGVFSKYSKLIYYNNTKPYMTVTIHSFKDPSLNYKNIIYYDKRGLRTKEIEHDTIVAIYKHIIRK